MTEVTRLWVIQAIQLFGSLSLSLDFLKLRSRKLHPECQLKRTQPAFQSRVGPGMTQLTLTQIADHLELKLLSRQGRFRILDEWNLCLITGNAGISDWCPLCPRWQKGRAPVVHTTMRQRRTNCQKPREILIFGPEAIRYPRAHRWSNKRIAPRVQLEQGTAMTAVRTVHRVDKTQVIHTLADLRKEVAHLNPTLAVTLELPRTLQQIARRA